MRSEGRGPRLLPHIVLVYPTRPPSLPQASRGDISLNFSPSPLFLPLPPNKINKKFDAFYYISIEDSQNHAIVKLYWYLIVYAGERRLPCR